MVLEIENVPQEYDTQPAQKYTCFWDLPNREMGFIVYYTNMNVKSPIVEIYS